MTDETAEHQTVEDRRLEEVRCGQRQLSPSRGVAPTRARRDEFRLAGSEVERETAEAVQELGVKQQPVVYRRGSKGP